VPFHGAGLEGEGDGHFLFLSTATALLPAVDHDTVEDLYRYDSESGQLICITCEGEAGSGNGPYRARSISAHPTGPATSDREQEMRVASEDGGQVVFATKERLLPALDANRAWDVYEWRETEPGKGQLSLVSAGTGEAGIQTTGNNELQAPEGGFAGGISANGSDIIFSTGASLLGDDTDASPDLYDLRSGGGFPEPATPASPCAGEAECRGPAPAAPAGTTPVTSGYSGPGNPPAPRACNKNQVRRGGKCRPKKQRHKKKQHARRNGGAK
jgi:hypothetical protein